MDEQRSPLGHNRGKIAHRRTVEKVRRSLVAFRPVHIGVGGAVDNRIDAFSGAERPHRVDVGNVKPYSAGDLDNIGEDVTVPGLRG